MRNFYLLLLISMMLLPGFNAFGQEASLCTESVLTQEMFQHQKNTPSQNNLLPSTESSTRFPFIESKVEHWNKLHRMIARGNKTNQVPSWIETALETEPSGGDAPEVNSLTASFTVSATNVSVGDTILFTNTSTGSVLGAYWDFGDGTNSTSINAMHAYAAPGVYTVGLGITDGIGYDVYEAVGLITVTAAQSSTVYFEEDFGGGSIPTGWSVTDGNSMNYNWYWSDDPRPGIAGYYSSNNDTFRATTADNGYMMISGDIYNAGGNATLMDAWLISPSIDFSGISTAKIEWQQYFRYCCSASTVQIELGVSTDNGLTWTFFDARQGVPVNVISENPAHVSINVSSVVANAPSVKFAWHKGGASHYFWAIDDIQVVQAPANDLVLTDARILAFNPTASYYHGFYSQIPLNQVQPLEFSGSIYNAGVAAQTNVNLFANVSSGGTSVFNQSSGLSNYSLASDSTDDFVVSQNFTASAIGTYESEFTATALETDQVPENNTGGYASWVVQSNPIYARDIARNGSVGVHNYTAGADGDFIGVRYTLASNQNLHSFSAYIASNSAIGATLYPQVYSDDGVEILLEYEGTPVVIDSLDVGTWVHFEFPSTGGGTPLYAVNNYIVGLEFYYQSTGGVVSIGRDLSDIHEFSYSSSIRLGGDYYYFEGLPMIRLNLSGAILPPTFTEILPKEICANTTDSMVHTFTVAASSAGAGPVSLSMANPPSIVTSFTDNGNGTATVVVTTHPYHIGSTHSFSILADNGTNENEFFLNALVDTFPDCQNVPLAVPDWEYTITGNNHTILIQNTIPATIDNVPVTNGDYIGVFFEDGGELHCAGYELYTGASNIALTAWGDDTQTSVKDGLGIGEVFKFKIFRASDQEVFDAQATYIQPPAFPNTGEYQINGMSGLASLIAQTVQYQTINIPEGWRFISTYIDPFEPNIADVLSDVVSNVTIVKNATGQTYWPIYSINTIGAMQIGKAYQLYSTAVLELVVEGLAVEPENTPISLPAGWSYLGYLRQTAAPVNVMMSAIDNYINIMKNSLGQTYWPLFSINTIGNMNPGEGYQVNMSSSHNYTYPANSTTFQSVSVTHPQPVYFPSLEPTGNNMSVAIPSASWALGSELAAYRANGELVGSACIQHPYTSISIWGKDDVLNRGIEEGEVFFLKHWNGQEEQWLEVVSWTQGDDAYRADKMAVAGEIQTNGTNFLLMPNVPNPFQSTTQFRFYLPEAGTIRLSLFNVAGQEIAVPAHGSYDRGLHQIDFDRAQLPAGTYYYRLESDHGIQSRKMLIMN